VIKESLLPKKSYIEGSKTLNVYRSPTNQLEEK